MRQLSGRSHLAAFVLMASSLALVGACSSTSFLGASGTSASRSKQNPNPNGGTPGGGATAGDTTAGGTTAGGTDAGGKPDAGDGGSTAGGSTAGGGSGGTGGTDVNAGDGSSNGGVDTSDGETCVKTTLVPAQSLSTTNGPFLQKPKGESNQYGPWMDTHGTTPLPPKLVYDGLKAGDTVTVTDISGSINDGDGLQGTCKDGSGSEQAILKHILIMQFTDGNDKVQDPGVSTFNSFGAMPVRDLMGTPLKIPAGITRAYVGIGDTRYSDNHSQCTVTLQIKTHVACKP